MIGNILQEMNIKYTPIDDKYFVFSFERGGTVVRNIISYDEKTLVCSASIPIDKDLCKKFTSECNIYNSKYTIPKFYVSEDSRLCADAILMYFKEVSNDYLKKYINETIKLGVAILFVVSQDNTLKGISND